MKSLCPDFRMPITTDRLILRTWNEKDIDIILCQFEFSELVIENESA